MNYIYIFLTVLLTVYGQIIIKWQVMKNGILPVSSSEKLAYLFGLLINPWVISGLIAAFLASLTWMLAVSKLQLSYAYPFVSFSFVLVLISGALFFHEVITPFKLIGMGFVILGIIIGAQT